MKTSTIYPLRLPASTRAEVEKLAKREGISVNQFIALAVAQKVSALNATTWFAERRSRADMKAFDRLIWRKGGEAPRPEDTKRDRQAAPPSTPRPSARQRSMPPGRLATSVKPAF